MNTRLFGVLHQNIFSLTISRKKAGFGDFAKAIFMLRQRNSMTGKNHLFIGCLLYEEPK
jgi:hypothetical protein